MKQKQKSKSISLPYPYHSFYPIVSSSAFHTAIFGSRNVSRWTVLDIHLGSKRKHGTKTINQIISQFSWYKIPKIYLSFRGSYRRWTMKSNPCCIIVNPRTPKFQCCLWAARLGPVDKKIKPWTQRKLDRVLCNIEIWGVGFYLVDVCGVWFFCPSTVIPYIYI